MSSLRKEERDREKILEQLLSASLGGEAMKQKFGWIKQHKWLSEVYSCLPGQEGSEASIDPGW